MTRGYRAVAAPPPNARLTLPLAELAVDVAAAELPGSNGAEVVLCESPGGEVGLDVRLDVRLVVRLERASVWLTHRQMAESPAATTENVGRHPMNVYAELESSSLAIRGVSRTLRGD